MKRCTVCVYPDTKPDLFFDEAGVCSACRNFANRPEIDWAGRKRDLEMLLEHGRNSSGYDCIVPSSGGKDSHWQVLTMIEMGARPLVVTASTCHLTAVGRQNIDNLKRYATTIEVSPNTVVRAKLNRLGLSVVGDISYPEHLSIYSTPFRVSAALGIPLVFYGEQPQREYGGPPGTEMAMRMTQRWVAEFGGLLGMRASDVVHMADITEADMADYMPPDSEALEHVQAYFLGQFLPWDSHLNAEVARKHGMLQFCPSPANWWDHENLDCTFTSIHDHLMYRKYGYGRLAAQISVDIRNGRIARDAAMEIVHERDGIFAPEYANVSVYRALESIGINSEELHQAFDKFTNWRLFDKIEGSRLVLKDLADAA